MKKLLAATIAALFALTLAGCAGGSTESGEESPAAPAESQSAEAESQAAAEEPAIPANQESSEDDPATIDFDGTGLEDTGEGTMTLSTAGGTTEGGNIPQVAAAPDTMLMQIGIDYNGGDGTLCTVYIDGMENTKMNAAAQSQNTLTLEGAALAEGTHTVEMVAMDGETPTLYKSAQYEIVF